MNTAWLPVRLLRSTRCLCLPRPVRNPYTVQQLSPTIPASSRSLATTSDYPEPRAAAEITSFSNTGAAYEEPELRARIVPASPSYFTGTPDYIDTVLQLEKLLRRHERLPVSAPGEAPRVAWRTLPDFNLVVGNRVKSSKYVKAINILKRLNEIHPSVMPEEVQVQLNRFKRDVDPSLNIAKPIKIDRFGRAVGTGRRKSSSARAWVVEGDGEVLINGKSLTQAFGRIHDRESAIWALRATERMDKYNVWALVEGGGTTGQAEALTLAVAKALLAHEPSLKAALRRAGCVTRDPRRVERKKPGHLKARKMPGWIAR